MQPAGGHGPGNGRDDKIRVFRAEKSYAVTQGKWYFEFEAVTVGEMRVGWARPSVRADTELGTDELAYVFNGYKVGELIYPLYFVIIMIDDVHLQYSIVT